MKTLLVGLLGLAACVNSVEPPDARPFDPPPHFADLWREVEACGAARGDWRRVRWFVFDEEMVAPDGGIIAGFWRHDHSIYIWRPGLGPDSEMIGAQSARIVQHEMLHDLLGRPDHPAAFTHCGIP